MSSQVYIHSLHIFSILIPLMFSVECGTMVRLSCKIYEWGGIARLEGGRTIMKFYY